LERYLHQSPLFGGEREQRRRGNDGATRHRWPKRVKETAV
jgi:hypothetical protein